MAEDLLHFQQIHARLDQVSGISVLREAASSNKLLEQTVLESRYDTAMAVGACRRCQNGASAKRFSY